MSAEFPQVLEFYNPYGLVEYSGAIPLTQSGSTGRFNCTMEEFLSAFEQVTIAEIMVNGIMSNETLSTVMDTDGRKRAEGTLEFSINSSQPFNVMVSWAGSRWLGGCSNAEPVVTLSVAKKDNLPDSRIGTKPGAMSSATRAFADQGPGDYIIYVSAEYPPGEDWISWTRVSVYADEVVQFKSQCYRGYNCDTEPAETFMKMNGLCNQVSVEGAGDRIETPAICERTAMYLNGVPALQCDQQQLPILYWSARRMVWSDTGQEIEFLGQNQWEFVANLAEARAGKKYDIDAKYTCLLQDKSLLELAPTSDLKEVKHPKSNRNNRTIRLDSELVIGKGKGSSLCAEAVKRLNSLGESHDIAKKSVDVTFPHQKTNTIAAKGTECDETAGKVCAVMNEWLSIQDLLDMESLYDATTQESAALGCVKMGIPPWQKSSENHCLVHTRFCSSPTTVICPDYEPYMMRPGTLTVNDVEYCDPSCKSVAKENETTAAYPEPTQAEDIQDAPP